jgi:hypothetical protein
VSRSKSVQGRKVVGATGVVGGDISGAGRGKERVNEDPAELLLRVAATSIAGVGAGAGGESSTTISSS